MKIEDLKKILKDCLDNLEENYEDEEEVYARTSSYGCGGNFLSIPSVGIISLYTPVYDEFGVRDLLTKEQYEKFSKLDNTDLYTCVEDRQSGQFGVDLTLTIKGWVAQALEWESMDEAIIEDNAFVDSLLEGGEQAIESIDDFWEITIQKRD